MHSFRVLGGLTLEIMKWAGTVTTASFTFPPRYVSAGPFILTGIMTETSSGPSSRIFTSMLVISGAINMTADDIACVFEDPSGLKL